MLKALIVDDSRVMRIAIRLVLERLGIQPLEAEDGTQGIECFKREAPDIVLIDVYMPGRDGFEIVRELRALSGEHWVPIIFLSSMEGSDGIEKAIACGGDDFITKPVSPVVLEAKIRALRRLDEMRRELVAVSDRLREANGRLEQISHQDGLTGLGNRRLFDLLLLREISNARRDRRPLSLLLGDIDHFKAFNDTYGHVAGDDCLRRVGAALRDCCHRGTDVAARYGGEEFAFILPDTPEAGAHAVATSVLHAVQALGIEHGHSSAASYVTMSMGLHTIIPEDSTTASAIIARADEALYDAKRAGRNRVVASTTGHRPHLRLAA